MTRIDDRFPATRELRDEVVGRLRGLQAELTGLGVAGLALYGSVARAEGNATHDVDLAVTLAEASDDRVDVIQRHLTDVLGRRADITLEPVAEAWKREKIDRSKIVVF